MSLHIQKQLVLYLETHKFNKPNRLTSQGGFPKVSCNLCVPYIWHICQIRLSDVPTKVP